ncbi:GH1 family beta-glucosidase [Pseudarthrobacter sp. J75]|uniref:GH1 family beta-glucosidase n=1 Tax=unclassified Pseudarthrobacter TaxID=2647000 RepID=UPI002E80A70B|nr:MULTISPECIES: GH1 family beta-glucosidase [unclassified Pseudarthrobacter]MEE2522314.1 GH1 family beta-glucosidase [Pseudarthrobacter sp. J47]MEE2528040.1 GH1 family beta-glucosidase [Pseudarthrobacter sp. J75]
MHISAKELAALIPPDFTLGVATSAFQIEGAVNEGGRGPAGWDVFATKEGAIVSNHSPAVAADHYHRMPADVELLKQLGVDSYRFSLAWPRIQPTGKGPANQAGLDFYDRLIDELLANGISPMATLYHWDTPLPLDDDGGWMNRDTAYRLGEFAAIAAEAFGDRVDRWVTINEPATVTANGYALGLHAPGEKLFLKSFPTVHHQLLGHGLALQALRNAKVAGEVGMTNVYSPTVPNSINPLDKIAAGILDLAQNRLYADPVLTGNYPDMIRAAKFFSSFDHPAEDMKLISQPLDFYGLNYYMPTRVAAGQGDGVVPQGMADALGEDMDEQSGVTPFHITPWPDTPTTAYGWPVKPEYLAVALKEMAERYPNLPPVIITEGGASFEDIVVRDKSTNRSFIPDERRLKYLSDHLETALRATAPGGEAESIDLRGYYVWSLLDNFEWSGGYEQRFGLVHVDFETQERSPKASYYWFQELIEERKLVSSADQAVAAAATGTGPEVVP